MKSYVDKHVLSPPDPVEPDVRSNSCSVNATYAADDVRDRAYLIGSTIYGPDKCSTVHGITMKDLAAIRPALLVYPIAERSLSLFKNRKIMIK